MNDPAVDAEARQVLARSAQLDMANSGVLRDLALAEARLGNQGAAALATAERHLLEGSFSDASRQATRAADLLPNGSPGWRQAQDVLTVARRALN
jgi:predicted Zn-dependent protease